MFTCLHQWREFCSKWRFNILISKKAHDFQLGKGAARVQMKGIARVRWPRVTLRVLELSFILEISEWRHWSIHTFIAEFSTIAIRVRVRWPITFYCMCIRVFPRWRSVINHTAFRWPRYCTASNFVRVEKDWYKICIVKISSPWLQCYRESIAHAFRSNCDISHRINKYCCNMLFVE